MKIIAFIFAFATSVYALTPYNFNFIYMQAGKSPITINSLNDINLQRGTVLIMGGIQGDEPGGFNAASIFAANYKVDKDILVIPASNFHSMLNNHRGIYGDMNRKFSDLKPSDKEFDLVNKIKSLILDDRIGAIFHLHDGSGFYNPQFVSKIINPNKWGNSSIIDEEIINVNNEKININDLAKIIIENVNKNLLKPSHAYYIRNTHTATMDKEMQKALTFFAISNGKLAIANEASKELNLYDRVYYHLLALEGFLKAVNIGFSRDFDLNPKAIYKIINDPAMTLSISGTTILPALLLRANLAYFPLPSRDIASISITSRFSYIFGLRPLGDLIQLKYGNRVLSRLSPFYIDFDYSLEGKPLEIIIDGVSSTTTIASIVEFCKSFEIAPIEGYRVNVIGYDFGKNEAGKQINKSALLRRFSIDKNHNFYRVEIYKTAQSPQDKEKFAGMILVKIKD